MKLNSLAPAPGARPTRTRVGRGIGCGKGKTSGSGHKGQKARSGGKVRIGFEGGQMPIQRRLPKFGFKSRKSFVTAEVRLSELNKLDGVVNIANLQAANIITKDIKFAKVMLSGEISKAVTIEGDVKVTKGAKAAIEAAGGKVEA